MLESCTDNNSIDVSAGDNPPVLSRNLAHWGVELLWKHTLDDNISPCLENISSDRIVEFNAIFPIRTCCLFQEYIYHHPTPEFQEYFEHLSALYDSLSTRGYVPILGDLISDLGNSLDDKGNYELNQRDLKLLDLADFFNLCPVNLLGSCSGLLQSYISHCGRYRSTIDYIPLPNYLARRSLREIINSTLICPFIDG